MMKKTMMKGSRRILKAIIFFSCLSFVLWQVYLSFQKFLQNPRSTSLSLEFAKDWPFPRFTVCSKNLFDARKEDVLDECGIFSNRYDKYTDKGYWIGIGHDENCTDPKKLYENAMNKPEEFIHYAKVYFHSKPGIFGKLRPDSSWWKPLHHKDFGRCYEFNIPQEKLSWGISEVRFYFKYKLGGSSRVYAHIPGFFLTNPNVVYTDVKASDKITMDMEHDFGRVLQVGGEYCNPDQEYTVDQCVHQVLFNESMIKLGCTSPWGPIKDHICINQTIGFQAHFLYKEFYEWRNATRLIECPRSCDIMKLRTGNQLVGFQKYMHGSKTGSIWIKFFDTIIVTSDSYSYIWLNLIAEAGGYVGLFLGYSVFSITDLMDKFMQ